MEPTYSTRFHIVHAALADIRERLASARPSDEASALQARVAEVEQLVASWDYVLPTEEERAHLMGEVLELNMTAMRIAPGV